MICISMIPLFIDFLISLWYTFWIIVAGMIYIGLFKIFTRIGGRKKAGEVLGGPGKNLEECINRYDDNYTGEILKSIGYENKRKCILSMDRKWTNYFIQLCHWSGYQLVLRKDSEYDIESKDSELYNMDSLKELDGKFVAYNSKTKETARKLRESEEDLEQKFKL